MATPDVGPFHYARLDQVVRPFEKKRLVTGLMQTVPSTLADQPIAQASDRDGVKYTLADNSWLLIRPSGTEPLLRIYAESRTPAQIEHLLQQGARLADQQLQQLVLGHF